MALAIATFEDDRFHPAALIFPGMQDEEMDGLVENIRRNGLLEPIWTFKGRIIDGRHRYQACIAANVAPRFREWDGNGSLIAFVVALNLKRRHLTEAQKATIAVELLPPLEDEARDREQAGVHPTVNLRQGTAASEAAAIVGTNENYVYDAKRLKDHLPEVYGLMREGQINVPAARAVESIRRSEVQEAVVDELIAGTLIRHSREINERARELAREVPSLVPALRTSPGQYTTIVADPPWRYDNVATRAAANNHYPTLDVDEICSLPIIASAAANAHLYLWTTNAFLPEAFRIIDAWGFTYKTTLVWVKPQIGIGNYFRSSHEFILFAIRGKLPVLNSNQRSWFECPRGKHSRKPEQFYDIVETASPGPYLELFARPLPLVGMRPNWTAWGNEA